MQRIAIIGSSGHYGRAMMRAFRNQPSAKILGIDVCEPPASAQPDEFFKCDVRSDQLRERLQQFKPDTVLHFAFIVDPIHDDDEMHSINVQGTQNVMEAVREIQPERFMISSSATAYGASDDNPVPMSEAQPPRSYQQYRYATDKVEVEGLLQAFKSENPQIKVSWTRPTIIWEPGLSNYLTDLINIPPLMLKPSGNDTELQFVHGDDLVAATHLILKKNATGPFNIAPCDWVTISEIAQMSRRFTISFPCSVLKKIAAGWWALRLPLFRFPPGFWNFVRYSWVIEPDRLVNELGYEFKYSAKETLQMMLDHHRSKS